MLHWALPGSHCACLVQEAPLYLSELQPLLHLWRWVLMWSRCSTAGPHLPQVVVSEESVDPCLCIVWVLQNPITSLKDQSHLIGLPQIGWKTSIVCWRSGLWKCRGRGREDLERRRHLTSVGKALFPFLRVSKGYPWLRGHSSLPDLAVLQVALVIPPFPFSHLTPLLYFTFLPHFSSLALFCWPMNISRLDNVGLRDGLRWEFFWKMNYS